MWLKTYRDHGGLVSQGNGGREGSGSGREVVGCAHGHHPQPHQRRWVREKVDQSRMTVVCHRRTAQQQLLSTPSCSSETWGGCGDGRHNKRLGRRHVVFLHAHAQEGEIPRGSGSLPSLLQALSALSRDQVPLSVSYPLILGLPTD